MRRLLNLLWLLPVIYFASLGPMTHVLRRYGGDTGYVVWQRCYGDPLGKLPQPARAWVNRYLGTFELSLNRLEGKFRSPSPAPRKETVTPWPTRSTDTGSNNEVEAEL